MAPRVLIGILAHARPAALTETLRSVRALDYPDVTTFLVQSGMTDSEFEGIAQANPWVSSFPNSRNLGAAGGRNYIIELARGQSDYILFLDSDALLARDSVSKLVQVYEELERPGLVGCLVRVTERPCEIHSAGVAFDRDTFREIHHVAPLTFFFREHDAVIATAVMGRNETLQVAPRLDEKIFAYREDIDWCLQLQKAGYKNYVIRDAVAYHSLERPRFHPAIMYYLARNQWFVARKLGAAWTHPAMRGFVWSMYGELFRRLRVGTPLALNCIVAVTIGWLHAWMNRGGIAPGWMRRTPDQFLEQRFHNLLFQSRFSGLAKRVLGRSSL